MKQKSLVYVAQVACYTCLVCEREWLDELPPIWMNWDTWPICCGEAAHLLYPLVALAG